MDFTVLYHRAYQTWGEYRTRVIECEYEYLRFLWIRMRIRLQQILQVFDYECEYFAMYSWLHSWILWLNKHIWINLDHVIFINFLLNNFSSIIWILYGSYSSKLFHCYWILNTFYIVFYVAFMNHKICPKSENTLQIEFFLIL